MSDTEPRHSQVRLTAASLRVAPLSFIFSCLVTGAQQATHADNNSARSLLFTLPTTTNANRWSCSRAIDWRGHVSKPPLIHIHTASLGAKNFLWISTTTQNKPTDIKSNSEIFFLFLLHQNARNDFGLVVLGSVSVYRTAMVLFHHRDHHSII